MERVLARNKRAVAVETGTLITREYALHARFREPTTYLTTCPVSQIQCANALQNCRSKIDESTSMIYSALKK